MTNVALIKNAFMLRLYEDWSAAKNAVNADYDATLSDILIDTALGLKDLTDIFGDDPITEAQYRANNTPFGVVMVTTPEQPDSGEWTPDGLYSAQIFIRIVLSGRETMKRKWSDTHTHDLTIEESLLIRLEGYAAVVMRIFDAFSKGNSHLEFPAGTVTSIGSVQFLDVDYTPAFEQDGGEYRRAVDLRYEIIYNS